MASPETSSNLTGPAGSLDEINPTPPPLPSIAKVVAAAEKLRKIEWDVRPLRSEPGKLTAGGHYFDSLAFAQLPPDRGSAVDYANKIIARAVIAMTEGLTPSMIDQIGSGVTVDETNEHARDYLVHVACKAYVMDKIIAIANHGGPGPDGIHLPGPLALLSAIGVDVGGLGEPTPPSPSASTSATGASDRAENGKAPRPAKATATPFVGAPSKEALLIAIKYVTSTALGLTVQLKSAYPLSLELAPGHGFKRRFDEILGDARSADEKKVARALVLKTMVEVVELADMAGLRVWLRNIDTELLFDEARRGEVLIAYRAELKKQVEATVRSNGALGLSLLPPCAYILID